MVIRKLTKVFKTSDETHEENNDLSILLVEDDLDQIELLSVFSLNEIQKLIDDKTIDDDKREIIKNIKIIRVSDIHSLQKAVSIHKGVFLTILDCNIPDSKNSPAHDQFIKSDYKITGQHKSIDIITKHLPNAQITMISSLNRFRKIVTQYYKKQHNLNINFISKKDSLMIGKNVGYYLRQYFK